jgi:DNA helicase-2/ATP-dependent DNA helicase PcrA
VIADAGPYRDAAGFLARVLFGAASPLRALLADGSARAAGQVMAMGQLLALARSFGQVRQAAPAPGAGAAPDATEPAPPDTSPLREFLAHVRRLYAAKEGLARAPDGADLDAVRILTVHASKGLEFPVVYVPCLAAGRFPFKEMWEPCPPPPGLILGESASDHGLEETCLFFVALTRARDELVLSRAERYGKQKAKPSPFLDMVAPFFPRVQPVLLHWPPTAEAAGTGEARTLGAGSIAPAELTLDVEELEAYIHCPRQYEYSRRLRLSESDEQKGYLRFHTVVRSVLDGLRTDQQVGALPADETGVLDRLGAAWETDGPQGHVHEAIYAEAARRVVMATWRRLATAPPLPPWHGEMSLPLGGATVRARLDLAQQGPDGVRLVRTRVGKQRDDDRKALRLALLRAAARQTFGPDTPLRVELEYLETGTTVEVPDAGRYERDRLAKLESAVHGIRAGHFPPAPAEADSCRHCPFWIICPS